MSNKQEIKKETKQDTKQERVESVDLTGLMKDLEAMRAELKQLREEKRSLSEAEAKALEEAREDMITDDEQGILYFDEKYKDANYHYRIVDADRPGRVNKLMKLGYEIVYEDFKIGDNKVTNTGSLTGAVSVELGLSSHRSGVVMRCPLERYTLRQNQKVKKNAELTEAMMQDAANKSDFGEIEIGSKVFKK